MKLKPHQKRIKVTVKGRETGVYDGLTILQVLLQEGIQIPIFVTISEWEEVYITLDGKRIP